MAESNQPLKVFLCHGSADKMAVLELYNRLVADGVDAWLDVEKLLPGQNWQEEIPNAVRHSDVVLVCLSESSVNKEGYVQKEIRFALDKAEEMPEGRIYLIPARLEECRVPHRISSYQWVDLFHENGYHRLMNSLRLRANQIGASVPGRNSLSSSSGQVSKTALSSGEMRFRNIEAGKMELQPKELLSLEGATYFVQKLIGSENSGNKIIRSAHASDQVMQEDVGILHISSVTNQGDVGRWLFRAHRRAQNMNQAAIQSMHLPVIKKIVPPKPDLWVISQWIRGQSFSQYYPLDGQFPNVADMVQILGWVTDVCDGLAALHKLREVHGGISEDAIVIKRGRGAVLIDPAFAGKPQVWKLPPSPFDSRVDIAALGDLLYRSLTHQVASPKPASQFNLQIPADLEDLISKMQDGSVRQVLDVKRQIIDIRKKVRS